MIAAEESFANWPAITAAYPPTLKHESFMLWFWHAARGAAFQFEAVRKHQPGVRILIDSTRAMNGQATSRAQVSGLLLASLAGITCEYECGRSGLRHLCRVSYHVASAVQGVRSTGNPLVHCEYAHG